MFHTKKENPLMLETLLCGINITNDTKYPVATVAFRCLSRLVHFSAEQMSI